MTLATATQQGIHTPSVPTWNRVKTFVNKKETKTTINLIGNGGAAISNFLTFGSQVTGMFEDKEDLLERVSEVWTKFATGSQGLIGALDLYQKQNAIPFIGNLLEIPIAIFSSGKNLWLFRGVSQGLGQFLRAIDQREVLENGNPILINGRPKIIGGDFSDRGWMHGIKTTLLEIPKILGELITKPSNIKKLTHALTLASVSQIFGGVLALCGIHGPGALIRNIAGIGVDGSFMLDENKDNESDNKNDKKWGRLNLSSWFTRAGLTWGGAAIFDEIKRIPWLEDYKFLNPLVYFFDRLASVLYTIGNLKIKNGNHNDDEERNRRAFRVAQTPSIN